MKDIKEILIETQHNNQLLIAWYSFNNQIIKAEVRVTGVRSDRNQLELQAVESSFEYLKQMISGSGKLSFYIEEESLLFVSELRSLEEDGRLLMTMPEKHKLFDRREARRTNLEVWVDINWKESRLRKRCLDISSGGFSVVMGQSEQGSLQVKQGEKVEVTLDFGDWNRSVDANVVNLIKLTPFKIESCPYGGARISFEIEDDLVKQKIKKYLDETSRIMGELQK